MDEILVDFKAESKLLVSELLDILDEVEGYYENRSDLEKFGQVVDRIMGGAQSLEMAMDLSETNVPKISKYAEICKTVGYKASQIEGNENFFDVVVAFLLDATEMLAEMVDGLGTEAEKDIKEVMSQTFLERLQFIAGHFDESARASVAVAPAAGEAPAKSGGQSQAEIDALLKSLGV